MLFEQLSLADFVALSAYGKRVFVFQTILADHLTPINILAALTAEMDDGAMLESGLLHEDSGRYSFIAFDAMASLSVDNRILMQTIDGDSTTSKEHPFVVLRQLINQLSCVCSENIKRFICGGIGFVSYESAKYFENLKFKDEEDLLPDMQFKFYRTSLVFDHQEQKLIIGMFVDVVEKLENAYADAQFKIQQLLNKISSFPQHRDMTTYDMPIDTANKVSADVSVDVSDEKFISLVKQAKHYIKEGDAFQIVISRTFSRQYHSTPLQIYRTMRKLSPAPFMFYLPQKNCVLMGASPERLISVDDGCVTINPIAGTRKRIDAAHDVALAHDLLNDQKETAEHMMLVDLARNDIGAVSIPGSVKVKELKKVKHYSHVSHITSIVSGRLQDQYDALDALAHTFPAGTLTGAPKYRAMQIITQLENNKRGIYGGVICRLDFSGNLDTCIAIRTVVLKDGIAKVRAGSGIVYDSDPQSEANETKAKAHAVLTAISIADRGML